VAGFFVGSLCWPVLVYLVAALVNAQPERSQDLLGPMALLGLSALAELALLFGTFTVTFVHWRSLRWPGRLMGLLSVLILVLLVIWVSLGSRGPIWQD